MHLHCWLCFSHRRPNRDRTSPVTSTSADHSTKREEVPEAVAEEAEKIRRAIEGNNRASSGTRGTSRSDR